MSSFVQLFFFSVVFWIVVFISASKTTSTKQLDFPEGDDVAEGTHN